MGETLSVRGAGGEMGLQSTGDQTLQQDLPGPVQGRGLFPKSNRKVFRDSGRKQGDNAIRWQFGKITFTTTLREDFRETNIDIWTS